MDKSTQIGFWQSKHLGEVTLALRAKGLRCSCFQTIDDLRDTKFSMLNTVLEPKDIDK